MQLLPGTRVQLCRTLPGQSAQAQPIALQEKLGDIETVHLPQVGASVKQGQPFASVESNKVSLWVKMPLVVFIMMSLIHIRPAYPQIYMFQAVCTYFLHSLVHCWYILHILQALSSISSPVTGTVVEVNISLKEHPEKVGSMCKTTTLVVRAFEVKL